MINVYTTYTIFVYIMSMLLFFLILANLYLPYFFWGVPSAACLPFVSLLVKIFALRIDVSCVVHQNHFGPETWRADGVRLLLLFDQFFCTVCLMILCSHLSLLESVIF